MLFWSCHLLRRSLQLFTLSATWNTNSFPHILGPVTQVRRSPSKLSILCSRFFGQMFPHSGMFCLLFSIYFSYKYLYCSSNLTQIAACGFSLISLKSAQMSHLAATPTSYPHSLLYFTPWHLSPYIIYSCVVHRPPSGAGILLMLFLFVSSSTRRGPGTEQGDNQYLWIKWMDEGTRRIFKGI